MARLPLSALMSQALVAYTIEFDNEFEQRTPHITTVGHGGRGEWTGPWLTSQVMWTNFIRHIDDKGTPVRELQEMACLTEPAIKSRLHHLEWWRYLTIEPDPSGGRAKPRYRDMLVRLTPGGERARDNWKPLNALIDKRWKTRFGKETIDNLTICLRTVVAGLREDLPDYLPVVDFPGGFPIKLVLPEERPSQKRRTVARLDLSALMARALLGLALEFESDADVPITTAANVLRVIEPKGTALKDLPFRGGVAKEGVKVAVNFLAKAGLITAASEVQLTANGQAAQKQYATTLAGIEKRWRKKFGEGTISTLRHSLASLDQPGREGRSLLAKGIEPQPGAWRTHKRYATQTEAFLRGPSKALPHYPFISHRGGFPDGA